MKEAPWPPSNRSPRRSPRLAGQQAAKKPRAAAAAASSAASSSWDPTPKAEPSPVEASEDSASPPAAGALPPLGTQIAAVYNRAAAELAVGDTGGTPPDSPPRSPSPWCPWSLLLSTNWLGKKETDSEPDVHAVRTEQSVAPPNTPDDVPDASPSTAAPGDEQEVFTVDTDEEPWQSVPVPSALIPAWTRRRDRDPFRTCGVCKEHCYVNKHWWKINKGWCLNCEQTVTTIAAMRDAEPRVRPRRRRR